MTSGNGAVGPAARAVGATKIYGQGETQVTALDAIDVAFPKGRFTAIMGPSGSGKSTMLQAIGLLESGFGGRVAIGHGGAGGKAVHCRLRRSKSHIAWHRQSPR